MSAPVTVVLRLKVQAVPPMEGITPADARDIVAALMAYAMETGNDDGAIVEWGFLVQPENQD